MPHAPHVYDLDGVDETLRERDGDGEETVLFSGQVVLLCPNCWEHFSLCNLYFNNNRSGFFFVFLPWTPHIPHE